MIICYEELKDILAQKLCRYGVSPQKAAAAAQIFADNARDGVYSHGANRFPRVIETIQKGYVQPQNEPVCVNSMGALEQWDGQLGLGMLNAQQAMHRATQLAKQYGVGAVAVKNTNHWMRGGTYGWQAAEAGCIGICFTNTVGNMPVWGSLEKRLGNNPLVIAVPRAGGQHVVVDMAMTQYAYGKLEVYRMAGKPLEVPGGYDEDGQITQDAAAVEKTQAGLPIGYWKGSGLSMMLDLVAAVLSGGKATKDQPADPAAEHGVSQVFITLQPPHEGTEEMVEQVIAYVQAAVPQNAQHPVRYPGAGAYATRQRNLAQGIPVDDAVWAAIQAL